MSDSDSAPKKAGVPEWQRKLRETTPTESDSEPAAPSRQTVIEQAKRFLEQDEVKDASREKRVAFLEGKGLSKPEIESLLESTDAAPKTSQSEPSPKPPAPQTYTPTAPVRDQPPIITYPEFLTTPAHPTPLVTKSRLLGTLYAFSLLSATLYGTQQYLVAPMLAQLTESRLSLAETASQNLQRLIERLENMVSEIPKEKRELHGLEVDEEDEDPTEMFHRDIGIQTSLPSSPSSPAEIPTTSDPIAEQTARISSLTSSIRALLDEDASSSSETKELQTNVSVFREYLESMAFVAPSFTYGVGSYGGFGGNGNGGSAKEDDEITRVKNSIRGVKGVLLSARSFPGAGRGPIVAGR